MLVKGFETVQFLKIILHASPIISHAATIQNQFSYKTITCERIQLPNGILQNSFIRNRAINLHVAPFKLHKENIKYIHYLSMFYLSKETVQYFTELEVVEITIFLLNSALGNFIL